VDTQPELHTSGVLSKQMAKKKVSPLTVVEFVSERFFGGQGGWLMRGPRIRDGVVPGRSVL